MPGARIDQLARYANPAAGFSHASFEHVPHAELAADLADIDGLALVGKRRVAGDDEELADPGQSRDDVLRDAVGEIFLLDIGRHVVEGQNSD